MTIPGLPSSGSNEPEEGRLDHALDVELPVPGESEVRRARAGLEGDWEPGSWYLNVNWDQPHTYDENWGNDWDDAILLDD